MYVVYALWHTSTRACLHTVQRSWPPWLLGNCRAGPEITLAISLIIILRLEPPHQLFALTSLAVY
jgi:hypothetical protein